jgi:glucose/arabinose dehydrogenase
LQGEAFVPGIYGATASTGDGGPALDAGFAAVSDVAVGSDGALYLADEACVRVVVGGTVETFAGTCGVPGFAGDGGPALGALLGEVLGVTVGPDGAVYVADVTSHAIRRIPTAQ